MRDSLHQAGSTEIRLEFDGLRESRLGGRFILAIAEQPAQMVVGPRVVGLGVSQFNQLVNVALASFLIAGSVAYLNYAWLILMAPLGVFAMGFATAIFPTFAPH